MLGNRPFYVRLIMGADMRRRIFNETGDCLGVVISENEIETDIDADPIGFFRGAAVLVAFMTVQAIIVALAFWMGTRWHA